jgi:glycosyltransferase involved in cell wall biosynthesis
MGRLKILTWHTHGSYLLYLTQAPHDFYVLSKPGRPPGYGGRCGHLPWGPNLHDLPADEARHASFDLVLFQDDRQYTDDQYELLSPAQRALPKIYLEHDPPLHHPVESRHVAASGDALIVHVTPFNRLMWDNGQAETRVIEHGVIDPGYRYDGSLARGLVIVNHLARRGRRLGADLFAEARARLPLDLIGMAAEEAGGLGEVLHADLPGFVPKYRFLFNPIRYTSMGLAVIEAMMLGVPVVAFATTEMATVIENGVNGFADTDTGRLERRMRALLNDRDLAAELGRNARRLACERFGIRRFAADWDRVFRELAQPRRQGVAA